MSRLENNAKRLPKFFPIVLLNFLLINTLPVLAADVANSQEKTTVVENSTDKTTLYGTAKEWGLTDEEWAQYQRLMQGQDGLWYRQLTPPAVLGMRADSPADQQHFAEIVAQQEHDKVARELAFNKAIFMAMRRLYPDEPMIKSFDPTPFNPTSSKGKGDVRTKTTTLQANDRIALFEDAKNNLDVAVLPKLIGLIRGNTGVKLDIFFIGQVKDEDIQTWAKLNQIPTDMVSSGHITLNRDDGKLQKAIGGNVTPNVLLVRDGQSHQVSVWELG